MVGISRISRRARSAVAWTRKARSAAASIWFGVSFIGVLFRPLACYSFQLSFDLAVEFCSAHARDGELLLLLPTLRESSLKEGLGRSPVLWAGCLPLCDHRGFSFGLRLPDSLQKLPILAALRLLAANH